MSYGHALATASRRQDSIAAYRRCIALVPTLVRRGTAWQTSKRFALMRLKCKPMRTHLASGDITNGDRAHFHFAIGKRWKIQELCGVVRTLRAGQQAAPAVVGYDPEATTGLMRRNKQLLTQEFFAVREDLAAGPRSDFHRRLPRAGSTLVEQILASHSLVEGTMECRTSCDGGRAGWQANRPQDSAYPQVLATLSADQCRALGERYIEQTRIQRKTTKPFFIDKMPNNFSTLGSSGSPAECQDHRRAPATRWPAAFRASNSISPGGQRFTYSLEDIGRYYRDYVELMAHFDAVVRGKIHRVIYENMVDDYRG